MGNCGSNSTYTTGCRCVLCRDAHAQYQTNYRHSPPEKVRADEKIKDGNLSVKPLLKGFRGVKSFVIADALGVHRRTLYRWRIEGIPYFTADKIACRMGVHLSQVWKEGE